MPDLTAGVITGGHTFDVLGFQRLFRALEGVDGYIQALEEWAVDFGRCGRRYDALVFYNMHTAPPQQCPGGQRTRAAIDALKEGPGFVVLHHGILAFKGDPAWDDAVGMTDRTIAGYRHDERLRVRVADGGHPITRGLADWTMTDETYDLRNADGPGNRVLLTVDHPHSMATMAWTRTHGKARVFDCVFGHDDQAWSNETFRTVLRRGILWCAGRLA